MKSFTFAALASLVAIAQAHQGLIEPKEHIRTNIRNSGQPEAFTYKEAQFPCKYNDLNEARSRFPISNKAYKPGEKLLFRWPRNNHRGGFIAVAAVPYDKSTSEDAFNNANAVISWGCAEDSCRGQSAYNNLNGDAFCSQQSEGDCTACDHQVTIPSHLPTGEYTLQWRIFSHYDSKGIPNQGLLDYVNCVDIKVENPNPSGRVCPAAPSCDHFRGISEFDKIKDEFTQDINNYIEKGKPALAGQCSGGAPPAAPSAPKTTNKPPSPAKPTKTISAPAKPTAQKPPAVPAPATTKADWDFCRRNGECANNCCSSEFSDDGKRKCTPGGCKGGKKGDWEFCKSSYECANNCCSKKWSDDGKLKCTPGGC